MDNKANEGILHTGNHIKYRYYRNVPTDVVKPVRRRIRRKHGTKETIVNVPQYRKEYYNEDTIANFHLEDHSKLLPDFNGQKTIISNYLLRFWGPTFDSYSGGIIAYTYIILESYCWDKDYVWISLKTLGEQITCSINTVKKYLEILENHGFIIRFWREDLDNNNVESTILIKVRRTLPLISRKQYNNLPKKLRIEHDRFLARIRRESELEFDLLHNYEDVYEQLRKNIISVQEPNKVLQEELNLLDEYNEEHLYEKNNMTKEELDVWNNALDIISKKVSKPSFDTWFSKTLAYNNNGSWLIVAPNHFALEWLSLNYKKLILDVFEQLHVSVIDLKFDIYQHI